MMGLYSQMISTFVGADFFQTMLSEVAKATPTPQTEPSEPAADPADVVIPMQLNSEGVMVRQDVPGQDSEPVCEKEISLEPLPDLFPNPQKLRYLLRCARDRGFISPRLAKRLRAEKQNGEVGFIIVQPKATRVGVQAYAL